jgi:hypothetical protein
MGSEILMVVNVTAAMPRDMVTRNPTKTKNTSEFYNIWIWKFKLNL